MARLYWQGTSEEEAFPPWSVHGYRVLPWPGLALAPHIRFQPSAGCVAHSRTFYPIDTSTYAAFLSRLPFPCVHATPRSNIGCTRFRVHASPSSSLPPQCRRDLELIPRRLRTWKLVELFVIFFSSLPGRYFFVITSMEMQRAVEDQYNTMSLHISSSISRFMEMKHFFFKQYRC